MGTTGVRRSSTNPMNVFNAWQEKTARMGIGWNGGDGYSGELGLLG